MVIFGSEESLRNAVDQTRSVARHDEDYASVLELADRYFGGWRPVVPSTTRTMTDMNDEGIVQKHKARSGKVDYTRPIVIRGGGRATTHFEAYPPS